MAHLYVGILDGSEGTWGVRVPDLPGCHSGGDTADAAISDAITAAREWAAHMLAKSRAVPPPRSVSQIIAAGEIDLAGGEGVVMIPLLIDRGRMVRANLSFDAFLLEAIDFEARTRGLTRSAFIASAAREKILSGERLDERLG